MVLALFRLLASCSDRLVYGVDGVNGVSSLIGSYFVSTCQISVVHRQKQIIQRSVT